MITKNKLLLITATTIFVVAELMLCNYIQMASGILYSFLTLFCIFLAFLYVVLSFNKSKKNVTLLVAFFCTLCADFCLTQFFNNNDKQIISMIFFNGTQISYFLILFYNHKTKKSRLTDVISRIIAITIAITLMVIVLKENCNALSVISLLYYANLIMNFIIALTQYKRSKLFPIGLLLFACCDFFIGISIMQDIYLSLAPTSFLYKISHAQINIAWLFYVPSQTILALTANERKDINNL